MIVTESSESVSGLSLGEPDGPGPPSQAWTLEIDFESWHWHYWATPRPAARVTEVRPAGPARPARLRGSAAQRPGPPCQSLSGT
jgi:hypothetical protein